MIEEDRGTVHAVAWSELFPWLILFRCFRLSIGLRPLLLSSLAAMATVLGWSVFGLLFSGNPEIATQHAADNGCPWITFAAVANDPGLLSRDDTLRVGVGDENKSSIVSRDTNPVIGTWKHVSRPFREVFTLNIGSGREFQASKLAYSLLCALWALAVWAIAGGAITRDAAVQLASGERIGWGDLIGFAKSRWKAYVWAPLLPFLGILLGALVIAVVGLVLMRWNVGLLVVGILWPLILIGGFLMTLLLLGLAIGWPLMFATISTEGTDSFDALSRSYAYVFQRPLHLLFYTAVATGVGLLGWVLVFGFVQVLIALTQGAACWGSGGQFVFTADPVPHIVYQFANGDSTSHLGWLGDLLIRAWSDCARLLAVGYLYSFFWVSASGIYLLLRRDVDDTELDEVHLEDAGTEETFGLPEIGKDETGAPIVNGEGEQPLSETE
jgi:hypothetical protein